MNQPNGIDWKHVTFIIGQREDKAQAEWREHAFIRSCGNCKRKTYLEKDYPLDVPVLCNVCALHFAALTQQDPRSLLLYDMPIDLKIRLIDMAQEHRLPIEEVCQRFLEWKLGGSTKANLYHKTKRSKDKK